MQEQDYHHSDNKKSAIWTGGPAKKSCEQLLATLGSNCGFSVITGESGTGKTVLANWFFDELAVDTRKFIVSSNDLSEGNFFQTIANGFGLRGSFNTRLAFTLNFSSFLYQCQQDGIKVVLLIDDCQNLSEPLFDIIRHIGKIERDNQKLIQLFLFAQPSFLDVIENTAHSTFKNSCSNFFLLKNFNRQESSSYISHCLKQIGCTDSLFCLNGLELIHRASGGVVEKINNLCEKTLIDLPASGSVPMSKIYTAIESLGFTAYDEPVQEPKRNIIQERIVAENTQEDLLIGTSEKAGLIKPSDDVVTSFEEELNIVEPPQAETPTKKSKKTAVILISIIVILGICFYGIQRFKQMATDTVNSEILALEPDKKVDAEVEPTVDVAIEKIEKKSAIAPAEMNLDEETIATPETLPIVAKVRDNEERIEPINISEAKEAIESAEVALINAQQEAPEQAKDDKLPTENKTFIIPLFAGNEYIITLAGRREMNKFSAVALEYPDAKILVKGYVSSDNDSPENVKISERRAEKMANRLVENGLTRDRLEIVGMGVQNPIATNKTQDGRNQNRRVELVVTTYKYEKL